MMRLLNFLSLSEFVQLLINLSVFFFKVFSDIHLCQLYIRPVCMLNATAGEWMVWPVSTLFAFVYRS